MSKEENKTQDNNVMAKIATFIVDKRNLFFFIFIILTIFSAFSYRWVNVENDIAAYLADHSETRQGLDIMGKEFLTYGTAKVMVANIAYEQAEGIADTIKGMEGVSAVVFDDSKNHYNNASALLNITFAYKQEDKRCVEALDRVVAKFSGYDLYVQTTLGNPAAKVIANEMIVVGILVAVIVVGTLLLTLQSYAAVPVLLLTFMSAAVLNMGTNFFFGTISFISNSVTIVLQLALSIDYAIILYHRFMEEHETLPVREAAISALSKAIPEISASSMTTISGLMAMIFMQFKIGMDMGTVLIKAILLSLFAVFTLMPGLLILFSKWMDRTKHRNFVPKISFVGEFAYRTSKIVPPIFMVILVGAIYFSSKTPFVFGYSLLKTPMQNEIQIAEKMIRDNFGTENFIAMMIPAGDYETEKKLRLELESYDEVASTMGLTNVEAMKGYMLTDKLTPREFSELTDLDYEAAEVLYGAYAVNNESYGKVVGGLDTFSVPLIDMFMFLYEQVEEGYITLDSELQKTLDDAYTQMDDGKKQLHGENYSRMLIYLNLPLEGEETFSFMDKIHEVAGKYYGKDVYLAGESMSQYDLSKAFSNDNKLVSILSVIFVMIILLFTFKSVGMPVLLIIVIQGSIWISFSFPYLMSKNLFFMGYLIVSSIQMGANIDYAIVISSRYLELKEKMPLHEAIIQTMNLAFPTLITSGAMMAIAGVLIGRMTSEAAIAGIGESLGRGTFISLVLVMFVLPQILLLGDRIIERTAFTVTPSLRAQNAKGTIYVNGRINGQVSGVITGTVRGIIRGDVNALIEAGEMKVLPEEYENQEEENEEK